MWEVLLLAVYAAALGTLLVFSLSHAHLALVVRRARRRADVPACAPCADAVDHEAASVTVQLPIYNELHVAARAIAAAARLQHPGGSLRVQVLDDSTDDTRTIIDAAAAPLGNIAVLRREGRRGFKAGALAYGLQHDDAEFVLVLDADFVPPPDLVPRLLAGFTDDRVAAVQARWGYLNETESLLTRVQAFLLSLHFGVEQPGRALTGGMLNFNGTAGMWRRAAIEDAGGWLARTVTEDIDLSYRAQLRGWRIAYLPDVVVPSELPADMGAVRTQQHRWIEGGAQNARLHLGAVLRHAVPWSVRWHAAVHLVSGTIYLVILLAVLLTVPLGYVKGTALRYDYTDWGLPFAGATAALGWALAVAQRPSGVRGCARFAVLLPVFLVFTMGLALHNGLAAAAGWRTRGGDFVRTPKAGANAWRTGAYARLAVDARVLREALLAIWLLLGLAIAWWRDERAFVPLQVMALTGVLWVVALSLWHPWRARRARRTSPLPSVPTPQEATP